MEIISILNEEYPNVKSLLTYESPYQLLIAVSLSAQTTDARVNCITPELFRRWPDVNELSRANPVELEAVIYSLGFYRQKARNLIAAAEKITAEFAGEIPQSMEALTSLPGTGRKSANVIRAQIWDLPGIIVDTHFGRVCRRLELTRNTNPDKVEKDIALLIPEKMQNDFSMTVNYHGRRYCMSRKPQCTSCPLRHQCQRIGL